MNINEMMSLLTYLRGVRGYKVNKIISTVCGVPCVLSCDHLEMRM